MVRWMDRMTKRIVNFQTYIVEDSDGIVIASCSCSNSVASKNNYDTLS